MWWVVFWSPGRSTVNPQCEFGCPRLKGWFRLWSDMTIPEGCAAPGALGLSGALGQPGELQQSQTKD